MDLGIVIFESKEEEVVNFELRNLAQLMGRIAKGRQNLRFLRWGNFELKKLAHVAEAVDPCSRSSQCTSELLAAVASFWPCAQFPTIVCHLRAFSVAKRVYLLSLLTEQLGSAEDFTSALHFSSQPLRGDIQGLNSNYISPGLFSGPFWVSQRVPREIEPQLPTTVTYISRQAFWLLFFQV